MRRTARLTAALIVLAIGSARAESAGSCVVTPENAPGAVSLRTITAHTDGVWNAVFSHQGDMLATCGQDGQVLVHALGVPDSMRSFLGETGWVLGLAFSPDDRWLASTGTGSFGGMEPGIIKIWDVATGEELRELPGHASGGWSLDFQESTSILASGGRDRLVKLWDPSTGGLLRTLSGHTGWVLSVDFHPSQHLVASSSTDRSIRIWNSATGGLVHRLTGHTNNVGFVRFSPDGASLASGADDGTVRLWNVADGSERWSVPAGQGWINGVSFSPDGTLLMSCGHDGSVVLRRPADGAELVRLAGHTGPVLRGSFNAGGTLFATASWDSTVRVWGVCTTGIDEEPFDRPSREASLSGIRPNPFNPATTISIDIPGEPGERRQVSLIISDVRGREVRTLLDAGLDAGPRAVVWDGRDDRGAPVPSGLYACTLRCAGSTHAEKMILVR